MAVSLAPQIASRFAKVALGHVTREYPNKLDHVIGGPADVRGPRDLHPIFFGSFDWHSCVHGHWLLAKLYRLYPDMSEASSIRALLDDQFKPEKVAAETAYLASPSTRGFERPYGWSWLLMLQRELLCHQSDDGKRWARNLKPLADAFADRFTKFLPLSTYPVRAGVHSNTAFALILALDYARMVRDQTLETLCTERVRAWYSNDADCPAWEPSQDEFLSSALTEAAVMRAALPPEEFRPWFARFLPRAADGKPATLFEPAKVSDRTDGKIAHLDGLNLSRAWCWRLILQGLESHHPARSRIEQTVETHIASALEHVAGDYMGEHWLASFALLALDP
jgi:hypothetical protein